MPTKQSGSFRRKNGELEQVTKAPKQQRYGAHAVHPSKVVTSESTAKAPSAAPAVTPSSAKTKAPVKGDSDVNAATDA
ncbi:hypothetical protein [Halomonas sp. 15WGF]|jgi:hypothetical protein|uniref:hypothetical protein n=1 Tax=Halomonas sp. 15WGF TaxID=2570357 RepID=UPI0010BE2816|nr:hypothetical protein [Halomonas sp. 15WGF]TKJ10204.1 hypothetical protein E8Q34_12265 [Halomonas sp. 15WGF]